jgi:hypothetical protein
LFPSRQPQEAILPSVLPEIVANENALVSLIAQFPHVRDVVETRVFPHGAKWQRLTPERFHDKESGRLYNALTGTSNPRRTKRTPHESNAVSEALRLSRAVYVQGKSEVRQ